MNEAAPRASATWATQAERSNLRTLQLMRWIAVTLGRRISRLVLHPITLYFLCFGGPALRASTDYLIRVLGRPPRWRERYRHVHTFASTVLDRVYLLRENFERFEIQVSGVEHLDGVLLEGQGALLIGAHFGSFEVMRALGQARRGLRVAMVMYEDNARLVNTTLQAIAPQADLHIIPLGRLDAMLALRDWLDGGGVAGLLADRTLAASGGPTGPTGAVQRSHSHQIDFLGAPATFSDGPFRLAALLRRRVVFMAGIYHGGNRYELRFAPLADFSQRPPRGPGAQQAQDAAVQRAMARYAVLLEALCREVPYNWFNFFDFWATDATHATAANPIDAATPLAGAAAGAVDRLGRPEPGGRL
ncbi:MAG: hypothetical protein RLY71_2684 [Pseudomonadota bacterium]|jgi:predicted LPLAT superfamily acyltransferase